ncbi:MAG: PilZ domain-containing protein [Elusimicrobiota bacterium]
MNQRKDIRIPSDFSINVNTEEVLSGKIINLSKRGLSFELDKNLKLKNDYFMDLNLSSQNAKVQVYTRILWGKQGDNEKHIYGAEIIDIDNDTRKKLDSYLDHTESKLYRIPHYRQSDKNNHDESEYIRNWLSEKTGADFKHIQHYSLEPDKIKANIENFIGVTQMPLGIAGPIKINGEHASGIYYVPMATTEGTLIATYQRGMYVIMKSGGANVTVLKNGLDISPIFKFENVFEAKSFIAWIKDNFEPIKNEAEKTTKHGKLLDIKAFSLGKDVILNFRYDTGDAMGLNMVNIATDVACNYIANQVKIKGFYLRSNLSSDKKASFFNFINSYGKEVVAEVVIAKDNVRKYLNTTCDKLYDFHRLGFIGSSQAGMIGANAHFANGLGAIYMACGQDVAQIVNASGGFFICEKTEEGDLRCMVKLPSLVVGTIGGGTKIGTHKECLEIMGCYGDNKVQKFAEIIAATILGGEIAIHAALSKGSFIAAHLQKRDILKKEVDAL